MIDLEAIKERHRRRVDFLVRTSEHFELGAYLTRNQANADVEALLAEVERMHALKNATPIATEQLAALGRRLDTAERIVELRILAARAEASVQLSLGAARYTSVRTVTFVHESASHRVGPSSPSFNMFAVSLETEGPPRDILLCRSPEIAKFIVALLKFGGQVVAECG